MLLLISRILKSMKQADLLKTLNSAQKAAVTHEDGPLLIVAGAGTGKSTVLINRLAYLIQDKGVAPDSILVTTFTEKGAGELEERADRILPYGYVHLWIHTFHGFGERILRDHALDIGLSPAFKLLTQTEQWILMKKNLDLFDLDYYRPLGDPTRFIHELIAHFSRLKDENISPAAYLEYVENLSLNTDAPHSSADTPTVKKPAKKIKSTAAKTKPATASSGSKIELAVSEEGSDLDLARLRELASAYHTYNKLLLDNGFLDFGDLIVYTLKLFRERPNILERYRRQFKYIMVDEFQDTNTAQYELIKLLAAPKNNLVAVGDDDQSIYKFRGASLSNILEFKNDYPKAQEIVLTENYRSGQKILDSAHAFISHNDPHRLEAKLGLDKKLKANHPEKGEIGFIEYANEFAETQAVAEMIEALHESKKAESWADMAILVRANDTADRFTRELTRRNIPNHFVSLRGLYYKPIILDTLAYLSLLDDHHDNSALYRTLNLSQFRVSHSDLLAINRWARKSLWSLFETLEKISAVPEVSAEGRAAVQKLLSSVRSHALLATDKKASRVFLNVVRELFEPGLDIDRDQRDFDYLNQFYAKIKGFEDGDGSVLLKDFLELMKLELDAGETGGLRFNFDDADTVKVMTVHAAKGLEFGYTFIPNLVDKKFPTIARPEKISIPADLGPTSGEENNADPKELRSEAHLEEERRLFYVALTRGKRGVYLSGAKDYGGAREKKPSRFIAETGLEIVASERESKNELQRDLETLDKPHLSLPVYELPKQFSFSQLATFERCPLEYKYIYILKMPTEDAAQAVFGRVLHLTLRQYFLPLLGGLQPNLFGEKKIDANLLTLKQLLKYYGDYWTDNGYEDRKSADMYKELGKKMLADFHAARGHDRPDIAFLEKKFTLPIGQYVLAGTIDRVDRLPDGSYEIMDYKTGKPKTKLDYKDKRQLLLYQAALEEIFGLKVSKLTFCYLKNGDCLSFTAKAGELDKVKNDMLALIEEIKKSNFVPAKNTDHEYCQHGPVAVQ